MARLPTLSEVKDELGAWKEYNKNLERLILTAESEVRERDRIKKTQNEVYSLFCRHVSPSKVFSFSSISVREGDSDGSIKAHYEHDGVVINFLGRVTWCQGDYDYFVDYSIRVDGNLVISREKE